MTNLRTVAVSVVLAIVLLPGLLEAPGRFSAAPVELPAKKTVQKGRQLSAQLPLSLPKTAAKPSTKPAAKPTAKPPTQKRVNCRKVKCVALTFDDGPVKQTGKVLDVLKRTGAKATFFVLGSQVKSRKPVLRRMVTEGHAVGNHSWNHPKFMQLSTAKIAKQVRSTEKVITAAIGKHEVMVRTPFGQQNKRIRKVLGSIGAAAILWNVDPQDWKYRNTKVVTASVVKHTHRNSIVLMHDIRPTTRAAVAKIVARLKAKGFVLVTVPELLAGRLKPGKVYLHG